MLALTCRSILGFLVAAPIAIPAIAVAAQDVPLVTVGADVKAEGVNLAAVAWPTIPASTVCTPGSIQAAFIEAFDRLPSDLAVFDEADGLITIQATEAA